MDEVFVDGAGGQWVSDEVLWQLGDQLGTVRDIVDDNGVLRKHVDYDSFGRIMGQAYYDESGELIVGTQPWSHPEAVDQLFYFQGRPWDPVAETYDFRARPIVPAQAASTRKTPSSRRTSTRWSATAR